ncbi:MAG TPA: ribosome biogenesis GTP-binding protein YsxC [Clostridiales bacterium]|nr:ribosome biogenesis GTP-binding protein YsxC [Clostridiales bacterium]
MTRQINYYNLDDELHFVDLPGYGYAAVSKGEKNLWAKVIEEYLNVRPQLYLVLLLLDIRHKPSKDDENMYRWILASGLEYLIVATKSDKISRQQIQNNTALIRSTLQIPPNKDIICVSAEKRTGIEALWDAIDGYITEEEEATK